MTDELRAVNALERLRAFVRNSTVALTAIHYDDASAILAHIDALTAERDAARAAVAHERAATVAWLNCPTGAPLGKTPMYYAAAIKAGEHLSRLT